MKKRNSIFWKKNSQKEDKGPLFWVLYFLKSVF